MDSPQGNKRALKGQQNVPCTAWIKGAMQWVFFPNIKLLQGRLFQINYMHLNQLRSFALAGIQGWGCVCGGEEKVLADICCELPTWDILQVPSSFWKQSANITAQTADSQTKWCPCAGRVCAQVFTRMPFAQHILLTWYRRLGIRLLPRLCWGGRMLFILYIYIPWQALRKEVLTGSNSLQFSGQLQNVNKRRFRC